MNNKINLLLLTTLVYFFSCSVTKKTKETVSTKPPVVELDTIEAFADNKPKAPYQPSFTKINDILHTKLEVSFDFQKQYLFGKATITIKPYFYPTSTLELDARGMEIKEVDLQTEEKEISKNVKQNSKVKIYEPAVNIITKKIPLKYNYENDVLKIELNREYTSNEQYTVFIEYISKPNELKKKGGSAAITDDKGLYFINPTGQDADKEKPQEIWTQGETQSNSVWFPTIDRPNERMTQEIYITIAKKFVTLSNGELVSSFDNGNNTRTDYWKMDLPHAPYLAMMAVGEFAIVKDKWRDKDVNYYLEKKYEPYAKSIFGNTPEMIEFFSNQLGVPFVWNKYSQIVVRDYVSGAMENTTATLHGEFLQRTDRELLDNTNEDVISHELFHQWFGDLVTCESWSNIPLNESFATYGEYLWREYKYGRDAADALSADSREGYLNEAERKKVSLIRFNYDDKEDMFDGHSYNKGGQVLHMLRKHVGDDAFFASLKLYLETNKFSSVEIHNLRLAFEKVTGEDLNWFFNQWFLSAGHPDLTIQTGYNESTKKVKIDIQQKQDLTQSPAFILPLFVDIYAGGKVDREKITIMKADETFEFTVPTKPDLINFDAEKQLLCTKKETKTIDEWAFQYKNAPLYLDRYEALSELVTYENDSTSKYVLTCALDDKYYELRAFSISSLAKSVSLNSGNIKNKIIKLAKEDEKSVVREAAINYLSKITEDKTLEKIYKYGLNDRSFKVIRASLLALSNVNKEEAMLSASKLENETNNSLLSSLLQLYSTNASDDKNDFFIQSARKFNGFYKINWIMNYGTFLKSDKKDETVNSGIICLASIANDTSTSKWVNYYIKKTIKDLADIYQEKERKEKENGNEAAALAAKAEEDKIVEVYNKLK